MLNAFRIFDVLTAESVESARCSLASRGAIDLAICDVHLEGPAALELIHELAVKNEAPALIILGGGEADVLNSAASAARRAGLEVLGCLPKPVSVTGLGLLLDSYQQACAQNTI